MTSRPKQRQRLKIRQPTSRDRNTWDTMASQKLNNATPKVTTTTTNPKGTNPKETNPKGTTPKATNNMRQPHSPP